MHPISVECQLAMRHATLSAEVRFVMKNLINSSSEREEAVQEGGEQRGVDPGDVALAILAWLPSYSWVVGKMATFGLSHDALLAARDMVPVKLLQSTRSMERMFAVIDRISTDGARVGLEDVLYASLAADSEFLGMFISEVLRRQDGIRTVSVDSILEAVGAPQWIVDEAAVAAESPFDRELRRLLASV